jgi:hypothetical protein
MGIVQWGNRASRWLLGVALLLATGGCTHSGQAPSHEDGKFQLERDAQGQLVRLNRITGELVIVDGANLIPVESPHLDSPQTSSPPPVLTPAAPNTRPTEPKSVVPNKKVSVPQPRTEVASGSGAESFEVTGYAGRTVTAISAAPIYASASQRDKPLKVASKGSNFKLLDAEGDYYQVEFNDSTEGRRSGFISKKLAIVDLSEEDRLKPVDLSVPGLSPNRLEPIDVSIRDHR